MPFYTERLGDCCGSKDIEKAVEKSIILSGENQTCAEDWTQMNLFEMDDSMVQNQGARRPVPPGTINSLHLKGSLPFQP